MAVVPEVLLGGDVDVLGQDVGQPARGRPAAPAAGGGGGGGGGGSGGGGVNRPADPVLHADAPLPAGRRSPASSAVLFVSYVLVAVALTFALRSRGSV